MKSTTKLIQTEVIEAAGGILWRKDSDELEIAIVHRPGHDDWSLPKGKRNTREKWHVTALREVMEETGVTIAQEVLYVESHAFIADDNDPVVDMVFLCRYRGGEARANDPKEVEDVLWLTYEEILEHPKSPPWTRASIENVENLRQRMGW